MADADRAMRVLVEIIRQGGGELTATTRLYKAFYFAHLYYAEAAPDYLSDWPIVKMPNGPGIHSCGRLVSRLVESGVLATDHVPIGPFRAVRYRMVGDGLPGEPLSDAAVTAIQRAVQLVQDKPTTELSEMTHEFSRSWNMAAEGEELNIYLDLIPDDEFETRQESLSILRKSLDNVFE
jgi:hypothetical protein